MENQPIRILQRPCANSDQNLVNETRSLTVKTLEQREAEYAAARRRIMGSHHSDGEEDVKVSISKSINKGFQSAQTIQHQCSASVSIANATPLMSIQATPTSNGGLMSDFNNSTVGIPPVAIPARALPNLRQGVAVGSNSIQKSIQQSAIIPRTVSQTQPQQQGKVLSGSASSPSLSMGSRPVQQPVPLFTTQPSVTAGTGLLPTPLGFHYAMPSTSVNVGLSHSQSAAFLLMHQINLFQQQYQQSMNGIHNSFPSTAIHTPTVNQMGLSSVISQPNGSIKHAHPPPAFN